MTRNTILIIGFVATIAVGVLIGRQWGAVSTPGGAGAEADRRALQPVIEDVLRAGVVDPGGVELIDGDPTEGQHFAITVTLGEEEAS